MSPRIAITVAAIIEYQGRFLLVEEEDQGRRVLNQPAGHLEEGESLVDAVIREVREETGLDFRPQGLVGVYRLTLPQGQTFLRFCFHGQVQQPGPCQPQDGEILACHWRSAVQIRAQGPMHRSPLVERCLDDYLNGRTFDLSLLADIPADEVV